MNTNPEQSPPQNGVRELSRTWVEGLRTKLQTRRSELVWPETCRCCGHELTGPYCAECGQGHLHIRLSLRALLDDFLDGLVNVELSALQTVIGLTVKPAGVCLDFINGRRRPYTGPFKYAMATLLLLALVTGLSEPVSSLENVLRAHFRLQNILALPFMAALTSLLFARAPRRLRWIEHLVVMTYGLGHVALLQVPLALLLPAPMMWLCELVPYVYLTWLAAGVYEVRWWKALLGVGLIWTVVAALVTVGVLLVSPAFA